MTAALVGPRQLTVLVGPHLELRIVAARSTRSVSVGVVASAGVIAVPGRGAMVSAAGGGTQGAPGPAQIYNGGAEPAAIPGYTLLWLKDAGTGDPNDRVPVLIE